MSISLNAALAEQAKIVMGCPPATLATTAGDGDFVCMKNYRRLTILIAVANGSTVTGGAVTLVQATEVAGSTTSALGFSGYWANTDTGASDALVYTAATNNTFTTSTTNSKNQIYVIQVDAEDLDLANGYDCVRVDVASMANATGCVLYFLDGARYGGTTPPTAITD